MMMFHPCLVAKQNAFLTVPGKLEDDVSEGEWVGVLSPAYVGVFAMFFRAEKL